MAKLKLSKGAMARERVSLKLYQRMLPSLDLKRRQLTVEHERARREVLEARRAVEELESQIGTELPMLAETDVDVSALVRVTSFSVVTENVVGVKLPKLEDIVCELADYSPLARPAWVDVLVMRVRQAAIRRLEVTVAEQRVEILGKAVRRTTQRVNLFDRILIPTAKHNIKRIQIFLNDVERDAVVRSKLAKAKGLIAVEEFG